MAKSAPWSLDQMRKNACNWTLEGDDQILQMMKRIGKSVEDKCIATSDKLHQLSLNVGAVKVQLANVNNKLLILQNDHFIDHRVQEDEDYLVAPEGASNQPCDNTKAEQPPKLSFEEAGKVMIKQTIKALDECYEKVTLTVIDSEDEEEDEERRDNIVFRPKDPYKVRPLPYLIGSEKWRLKWHVGMHETDSEDSDQENAIKEEEYSDSMSDKSNSMSWPSNATPSENSNYGLQSQNFYDNNPPPVLVDDIQVNKDRYFKPPDLSSYVPSQEEIVPKLPIPAKSSSHNLFANDSPPSPSIRSSIRPRSNLFDDDEPAANPILPASKSKLSAKEEERVSRVPVNLFSDEPPEDFEAKVQVNQAVKPAIRITDDVDSKVPDFKPVTKKKLNLFEDDNDDDDDFFKTMTKKPATLDQNRNVIQIPSGQVTKKVKESTEDVTNNNRIEPVPKKRVNLFADLDDDLFKSKNEGKSNITNMFKSKSLFDDEDIEDNLFGGKSNDSRSIAKAKSKSSDLAIEGDSKKISSSIKVPSQILPEPISKKTEILGDDEDDDYLFGPKPLPRSGVSIDMKLDESEIFGTSKSKPKGLFDDSDPEDIFAPKPEQRQEKIESIQDRKKSDKPISVKESGKSINSDPANQATKAEFSSEAKANSANFEQSSKTTQSKDLKLKGKSTQSKKSETKSTTLQSSNINPSTASSWTKNLEQNAIPSQPENLEPSSSLSKPQTSAAVPSESKTDQYVAIPSSSKTQVSGPYKPLESKQKSKGLFDDVDDDDDEYLFGPKPKSLKEPTTQKPSLRSDPNEIYLFEDEDDLFAPPKKGDNVKYISSEGVKPQPPTPLFEDSDDDEFSIFSNKSKVTNNEQEKKKHEQEQLLRDRELARQKEENEQKLRDEDLKAMEKEERIRIEKEQNEKAIEKEKQTRLEKLLEREQHIRQERALEEEKRIKLQNEQIQKALEDEKLKKEQKIRRHNALEEEKKKSLEKERVDKILEECKQKLLETEERAMEKERQKLLENEQKQKKLDEDLEKEALEKESQLKEELLKRAFDEESQKKKQQQNAEKQLKIKIKENDIMKAKEQKEAFESDLTKTTQKEANKKNPLPSQETDNLCNKEVKIPKTKSLGLFDDLEEYSDLFSKPVKPVSATTNTFNLFDEPPEDTQSHPVPSATDFYESDPEDDFFRKPVQKSNQEQPEIKNPVSLFSDLPPEDDEVLKPKESVATQKTNVFYDDIAESFPPKDESPKSSDLLFPDEPPDDHEDDFLRNLISATNTKSLSKVDRIEVIETKSKDQSDNVQSVRDLIKSHENPEKEKPEESIKPNKSVPNKLSNNLAINVSALLPGARPKPMGAKLNALPDEHDSESAAKSDVKSFQDEQEKDLVQDSSSKDDKSSSKDVDKESYKTPEPSSSQVPSDENPNMLTNLTKSRAKIQSKRRPSSRKGRQESLKKSHFLPDGNMNESQEDQVKNQKSSLPVTKKLFESDNSDEDIFKPKPVVQPEKKLAPKSMPLFRDSEVDDDDLFGKGSGTKSLVAALPKSSHPAPPKSEKKAAKSTPVFDDPLADLMK